jgi:Spy/CpxP family protein refolding chaperone
VNPWKVILATLVIFGAGIATGTFLAGNSNPVSRLHRRLAAAEGAHHATNASEANREFKFPPPLGLPLRKDFLDRLEKEIKLTPQQRERIEKIITEGQERTKELWEVIEPEMHDVLVETREGIRNELTPEQQASFSELLKRRPNQHPASNALPAIVISNPPAKL